MCLSVLTSCDGLACEAVCVVSPLFLPLLENAALCALCGSVSGPSGQRLLLLFLPLFPTPLSSGQGLRKSGLSDRSFRRGQLPFPRSQVNSVFSPRQDLVPLVIYTVLGPTDQGFWVARGQGPVRVRMEMFDTGWCSGYVDVSSMVSGYGASCFQ